MEFLFLKTSLQKWNKKFLSFEILITILILFTFELRDSLLNFNVIEKQSNNENKQSDKNNKFDCFLF